MNDKLLVSQENLISIIKPVISDLNTKIKNKDISLPYTTQLSKSSYIKIDGLGNMFLNNNGQYIDLGNINKDKLDIDKIIDIFDIRYNLNEYWDNTGIINMPTARYGFGCIEYNGKIYCIGGWSYQKVECYDILNNKWTNLLQIPAMKAEFGCVESNGKIYCIGGMIEGGAATNTTNVYDILSNTWSTKSNMPSLNIDFGCVEYNGKIYCIGGKMTGDKIQVYDIYSNTWSSNYNAMPTSRSRFGCVRDSGKIYCIGGYPNVNKIEVYDILSNTWSVNYSDMPTNIYGFGCILSDNKIYCIGGSVNITEVYDIVNNVWSTSNLKMPIPYTYRYLFGCVEYNHRIYCIGGRYNPTAFYNSIDVLHPQYQLFTINIPDSMYYKLNEIITNGDGTKIFHNNGKYTTITPTYQVMTQDTISSLVIELKDV